MTDTSGMPSGGFNIPAINVNLIALIAAVLFTIGGVKLTAFLPAKYYFSFAQFVNSQNGTILAYERQSIGLMWKIL
jgi:hypothetical protein